jgi:hypothetical protein
METVTTALIAMIGILIATGHSLMIRIHWLHLLMLTFVRLDRGLHLRLRIQALPGHNQQCQH